MAETWFEVRDAYERAIKNYTDLAARYLHRHQEVITTRTELIHLINAFQVQDLKLKDAITGLGAMDRRLEALSQLMVMTADVAKHYLQDVDPDNANGTTEGLKPSSLYGPFLGGNQKPGGPPVPPARQRLKDNSRNRTFVYTELAIAGLKDLIQRGQALIAWRKRYLDASGHGRLRHGGRETISDQRLKDRIEQELDPITGTLTDWETGERHQFGGPHVTAFVEDADLVWAEMMAVSSRSGRRKRKSVDSHPTKTHYVIDIPAADVFGPNFRDHVRGYTRTSEGAVPTVFPDDTRIRTVYRRASPTEEWAPVTCHPIIP